MAHLYSADLHLHTGLSPCADDDASPLAVVGRARQRGLEVIAVTDHNSCENAAAAVAAGERLGVTVWPGMELQTREEVHLVCIFAGLKAALDFQGFVYDRLPKLPNRPEKLGRQVIYDEAGRPAGECQKLLLASCEVGLEEAFRRVTAAGGLCYPAHVDRRAFGLIGVLGPFPPEAPFPAYEVSRGTPVDRVRRDCPWIPPGAIVVSSDAHRLEEIESGRTLLEMERPIPAEFLAALEGRVGRKVVVR